jgi:hypothetical protein
MTFILFYFNYNPPLFNVELIEYIIPCTSVLNQNVVFDPPEPPVKRTVNLPLESVTA